MDTSTSETKPTQSKNILVIDDEPVIQETILMFLEDKGHQVKIMDNALDALKEIRANPGVNYDHILCDVTMPEMDGASFYKSVCEVNPSLSKRITLMTGLTSDRVEEEFNEMNIPILEKPFSFESLLKTISRSTE